MSDYVFPASIPNPELGTFKESGVDPWVDDRSEVGPPRRRKRFTRALHNFEFDWHLKSAQKTSLMSFYDNDLQDGVHSFAWTHPESGQVYQMRFAARPSAVLQSDDFWVVSAQLCEI